MKYIKVIFLGLLFSNCRGRETISPKIISNTPDTQDHFSPIINKAQYDTLRGLEFTWLFFDPINQAEQDSADNFIEDRLSDGQKRLYYVWTLERAVTGSGFTNFFYNYKHTYPSIIKSLNQLGDTAMLNLVFSANEYYETHKKEILELHKKDKWETVDKLFLHFDTEYAVKHDYMMSLLENYIRKYPIEFAQVK